MYYINETQAAEAKPGLDDVFAAITYTDLEEPEVDDSELFDLVISLEGLNAIGCSVNVTATPDGEIYGYASMEWDNVVARTVVKDMENKIPNLIFCGGHSVQGDGYPSAFITGEMAANQAIKELKEGK